MSFEVARLNSPFDEDAQYVNRHPNSNLVVIKPEFRQLTTMSSKWILRDLSRARSN